MYKENLVRTFYDLNTLHKIPFHQYHVLPLSNDESSHVTQNFYKSCIFLIFTHQVIYPTKNSVCTDFCCTVYFVCIQYLIANVMVATVPTKSAKDSPHKGSSPAPEDTPTRKVRIYAHTLYITAYSLK